MRTPIAAFSNTVMTVASLWTDIRGGAALKLVDPPPAKLCGAAVTAGALSLVNVGAV